MFMLAVSVAGSFTSMCNYGEGVRVEKREDNITSIHLAYHCSSGVFVWDTKLVAVF